MHVISFKHNIIETYHTSKKTVATFKNISEVATHTKLQIKNDGNTR